ncbi:MAG: DUF488 domain-containing protein [Rhizobium sp.]
MKAPFFTIGHSDRSLDAFLLLLMSSEIGLVADIRRFPMSRANPQFNKEVLARDLATKGIFYEHMIALGGLRGNAYHLSADVNGFWVNRSFHRYADYALSEQFRAGLAHLLARGREHRCVIMCSEAVWWRCHRRIVSDYLIANDETVFHIMGQGRLELAQLTPGAVVQPDATIVYPPVGSGV